MLTASRMSALRGVLQPRCSVVYPYTTSHSVQLAIHVFSGILRHSMLHPRPLRLLGCWHRLPNVKSPFWSPYATTRMVWSSDRRSIARRFRPVPDHAKEGRCLDSLSSVLINCKGDQTRLNHMSLNNMLLNKLLRQTCSPTQLHRHGGKKNQGIRPPSCGPERV